ncbi:hypothetical protein ACES2I_02540 [Bdellovibrio bacteriovorus]|uniref:hypothetical protein n=1 Tax=Bdellovibrio bacteriovorus TaxID=959 RepID=UPI0035A58034
MTRKNFFLLGLAVIIGASVWLYFSYKGIKTTQDALIEQAERTRARRPASIPVVISPPPENRAVAATKARLQQEALTLQQQLLEANTSLQQSQQALESLRARQQEESQAPTADTFSSELQNSNLELQSFISELNSYDRLAEDINRRADEALRLQSSQAQVARSQIDENIRSQENYIRQTQDEIIYWQQNTNDLTARQTRLEDLNNLLLQQQQQLELMQNEKLLLSSQALQGPQSVQQARAQALSDLDQDRSNLQEEIAIRRSQIQSLQENIYESTASDYSLRRQLLQTQRAVEQQQQQIRRLESSLIEKNAELNALE